ncbi:MAG: hypothetical protein ACXWFI_13340 [Methylobacter sp.]
MKRNKIVGAFGQEKLIERKKRIAFHEAGHAAGIYLNNKARQLPSVFFNILFKDISDAANVDAMAYQTAQDDCIARVEGGRLIEVLPSIDSAVKGFKDYAEPVTQVMPDYKAAVEADIVNMLIGPLAEAKYIAEVDNEPFNHKLVNPDALRNYGGSSDLILVNDYLQRFSTDTGQKQETLTRLFSAAFDFVNEEVNWAAITGLAGYILESTSNIIGYEEIVLILDRSAADFKNSCVRAR